MRVHVSSMTLYRWEQANLPIVFTELTLPNVHTNVINDSITKFPLIDSNAHSNLFKVHDQTNFYFSYSHNLRKSPNKEKQE